MEINNLYSPFDKLRVTKTAFFTRPSSLRRGSTLQPDVFISVPLFVLFDKYGADGKEALKFFEKMKLVETRWQPSGGNRPEKAYHTYYNQFHINASWPVYEISDVLSVAMMPEGEFEEIETKILSQVGKEGKFAGDVAEALGITSTMLKSLVKRSVRLDYRGHRLELVKDA